MHSGDGKVSDVVVKQISELENVKGDKEKYIIIASNDPNCTESNTNKIGADVIVTSGIVFKKHFLNGDMKKDIQQFKKTGSKIGLFIDGNKTKPFDAVKKEHKTFDKDYKIVKNFKDADAVIALESTTNGIKLREENKIPCDNN